MPYEALGRLHHIALATLLFKYVLVDSFVQLSGEIDFDGTAACHVYASKDRSAPGITTGKSRVDSNRMSSSSFLLPEGLDSGLTLCRRC